MIKKTTFLLVLYLFSTCLNGFSQSSLLTKGKVMSKGFITEVEFEIFRGHIIIPAIVNGNTYRFMFDTGAPNMFVRDLFAEGGMDSIKIADTNQQTGNTPIGQIANITLGDIGFNGYGALEFDFNKHFPFRCYNIAGIIGSNLFRGLAIKIDYEARKLIITDQVSNLTPKVRPVKMTLQGHQLRPLLHLRLGEKRKIREEVLFDTGYNGFYAIARQAFEQLNKYEGMYKDVIEMHGKGSAGLYGTGENSVQYFATISSFSINKADFRNVMAATSDSDASMIGADILKYGNVILDFRKKRFYYEPAKEYIADPAERPKYIGSIEDEHYVIGFILDDALREQVHTGDRILKIDHIDISEMDPCDRFMIPATAKERLLVRSSDGRLVEVML